MVIRLIINPGNEVTNECNMCIQHTTETAEFKIVISHQLFYNKLTMSENIQKGSALLPAF